MSEFIVIIRPSFMRFCKDACRAATLNHLLFRIAGKAKDQPKEKIQSGEITWYAKTEQIREEMSEAWGACKIRQEVNALIDMGLIGRSTNPRYGADRTKHFAFGTEQCLTFLGYCQEHHICIIHLDLPPEVKHLIYSSNANDTSIKCSCENRPNCSEQMIHPSNALIDSSVANDESIRALTKEGLPKKDNKEYPLSTESNNGSNGVSADAPTPIPTLLPEVQEVNFSFPPKSSRDVTFEITRMGRVTPTIHIPEFDHDPEETPTPQNHDVSYPASVVGNSCAVSASPATQHSTPSQQRRHIEDIPPNETTHQEQFSTNVLVLQKTKGVGYGHPNDHSHPTLHDLTGAGDCAVCHSVDTLADPQPVDPAQPQALTKQPRTAKAQPKPKAVELVPTPEEQAILASWQSLFKRRIPVTEALVKAAGQLVSCEPTTEDLRDCKNFCFASNPDWYRRTGVHLSAVVDNWAKWQTTLDLPEETPPPGTRFSNSYTSTDDSRRIISSFDDPNFDLASEFYPSEAERRAQYAAMPMCAQEVAW